MPIRACRVREGPWGVAFVAETVGSGGQGEGQFGVLSGDWGLCGLPVGASRGQGCHRVHPSESHVRPSMLVGHVARPSN